MIQMSAVRMPVVPALAPRLDASPSAPAPGPAPAPTDAVERILVLQKRATRLHTAGDMVALVATVGMPGWAFPTLFVAGALMPGMGQLGAFVAVGGVFAGLIGGSVLLTRKGNDVRRQAEALNRQSGCNADLHWHWAMR
jgi:hypothetical protein